MSDDDVDYSKVDWTEIEEEMEALEVIFPEELTVHSTKPWKMDIVINSSSNKEENYLKMLVILEIPHDYPNNIPFLRLKNLSPEYLNNQILDEYEGTARAEARENIGSQMIFTICQHLQDSIAEINDKVLGTFNKIMKEKEEQEELESGPVTSNVDNLSYTPVNKETFGKWCEEWLMRLKAQQEAEASEQDLRPTGKQIFMEKDSIDMLTLEGINIEDQVLEE